MRTKTVNVRAYQRFRNGCVERVSKHKRRPPR